MAWPRRSAAFTASVAATMKLTSGSLNFESGVGTQIEIASGSLEPLRVGGGREAPGLDLLAELGVAHVLDVRAPGVEPVDHALADVVAEHLEAGLGQLDRERQPDVAEADDAEERLAALGLRDQILRNAHLVQYSSGKCDSAAIARRQVRCDENLEGMQSFTPVSLWRAACPRSDWMTFS